MKSSGSRELHGGAANGHCRAIARTTGQPCKNPAGLRTDHPGEGRCYLHGGVVGRQLKHGRYSTVTRQRIRDLIEEFADDPDPLNLEPELAALRALFKDYIERHDEITDALLAWNSDPRNKSRPARIPDLAAASSLLEAVGRMVERIEKVRIEGAVSQPQFFWFVGEVERAIRANVSADQFEKITHEIRSLTVRPNG